MMTENCNVRAKTYAFKRDDDTETKKAKGTKKCVIKHFIKFDDDKRPQTFDGIKTYPYGTNVFKVCESEMLAKRKDVPIVLYY